jgi:hypothetical protein
MNDHFQDLLEAQRLLAMLRELRRPGPLPPPVPRLALLPSTPSLSRA